MKIVFHGDNASTFEPGLSGLLEMPHEIRVISDAANGDGEAEALASADVVVGVHYAASDGPLSARLYQLPAAGYDKVDMAALPEGCAACNAFGHENAIAEYVMCALLSRHVPLVDADARLRQGDWHYWAGGPDGLRTELGAQCIGIVGFGHIGKAVAARAQAFGMTVHVANRSAVSQVDVVAHPLGDVAKMAAKVDILINTLPLAAETEGLIGSEVFAAMPAHAIIMNVGRGPVIAEAPMYEALKEGRIGGAILDTWYVYPSAEAPHPMPANLPFHELPNVLITPHMSGWTEGTIARRRDTVAENINRLARGEALLNRLR